MPPKRAIGLRVLASLLTRAAQNLCPLLAEEERPRDAGEDDSAATVDLSVPLQMRLP